MIARVYFRGHDGSPTISGVGKRGRRSARVAVAMVVGFESKRGDLCPYRKRKYATAWLRGLADQKGGGARPQTWRPRHNAELLRRVFGRYHAASYSRVRHHARQALHG